ncbi:hypothetical protein EYF80_024443 [Liparis tanakae]|uniref:Uncharacterized protein n=1 Tax=Liparis tanakae TaxID=230148 RepID=A0A4Z2HHB9_9TELE|nr:hypothetical protein EYF80_024443 [Liparis tanakae]
MKRSVLRLTASTSELGLRPPGRRAVLWAEPTSRSATPTDSTRPCSATAPPDTAGVWTLVDRRERGPGRHLVLHPKTVTSQTSRGVPGPTASSTETAWTPAAPRGILYWEPTSPSVTQTDSTHLNSATYQRDTAGVWTVGDSRGREPGPHPGHHPWTVTNQMNRSALRRPVSSTESERRPPAKGLILWREPTCPNATLLDSTCYCRLALSIITLSNLNQTRDETPQ